MVKLLLNSGTLVNAEDDLGRHPIHGVSNQSSLGRMASEQFLELFVQHGALIKAQDNNGATPLHIAAQRIDPPSMELFINYGSDINIKDLKGKSARDYVTEDEDRNMAMWLRDYDVNSHSDVDLPWTSIKRPCMAIRHGNKYGNGEILIVIKLRE